MTATRLSPMDLASFPSRFQAKITVLPSGCWQWTASKHSAGYGYFRADGKTQYAHRWAYQQVFGRLASSSIELDHFMYPENGCIGPACSNPMHVRPVTSRENQLRSAGIGSLNLAKEYCDRGHPFDEANTYWRADGAGRECRACKRENMVGYVHSGDYQKTHCLRGHDQATWGKVRPNGSRYCIKCNRIMAAQRAQRKREAA